MSKKTSLSSRVERMAESATLKMTQMARELRAQGHDVISLSVGEPDFDTPEPIKEACKKALDQGKTKYTPVPGIPKLREAISKKFKTENNLNYSASQIVVSNGAKQSIANICMALLDPGDEIVIFAPYWVTYIEIANMCGATSVVIHTDIESDFLVTPQQLEAALSPKTKAVLFSSPCNPSGSLYSKEALEGLAEILAKREDIVIISDEIYEYINFSGKHESIGSIDSVRNQTVTVNGFSKGFAMTGWRLGYLGGPKWLVKAINKVQGQTTSGASSMGQYAAIAALEMGAEAYGEMVKAFAQRRDLVLERLAQIPGIVTNHPKGAFYVFPDISHLFGTSCGSKKISNSSDFAEYILNQAHVAVVAGSAFGTDSCFRLSYAASEDQLIEAISRIHSAINKLK